MHIAFIETSSITNEVLRAYAGAHRLCCGYPDGVPETWRTVSAAQQEGGGMPDLPMKHFTDETRGEAGITVERFDEVRAALRIRPDSPLWAIEGVGLVREDDLDGLKLIRRGEIVGGIATVHEEDMDSAALSKCALCFFDGEPVCRKCGAVAESNARSTYPMGVHMAVIAGDPDGGPEWLPELDPAALLGPAAEPVGWPERDGAGDEEC